MIIGLSMKEREQFVTFERLKKGEISQKTAAKILKVSRQWVRKKLNRYKKDGVKGLVHRSRGKSSNKRWCSSIKEQVMKFFEGEYKDFGPTFAAEKLLEQKNIKISSETLRKAMIKYGYWSPKKRRSVHRKWRERKEAYGEMVQLDGSPHDWFEGRAEKCTLLVFVDDATSAIPHMKLVKSESTNDLMLALKEYIYKHGKPLSLYVDYGGVFSVNVNNEERTKITQFQRACQELDITIIHAKSPQAKGRVERSHATHQDRLVKELRLANISSMDEANDFIQKVYLPRHNQRFALDVAAKENVHRSEERNLDTILCFKDERVLQNDFIICYKKRILQLSSKQNAYIRPKETITVLEFLNGELKLKIRNITLNFTEIKQKTVVRKEPTIRKEVYTKPAPNHPWKTSYKSIPQKPKSNGGYL